MPDVVSQDRCLDAADPETDASLWVDVLRLRHTPNGDTAHELADLEGNKFCVFDA